MPRSIPLLAAVCLLLGGLVGAPRVRADEGPIQPTPSIAGALEELRSPAERDRQAAVRRLIDLLPTSREPVLEALGSAPPEVKLHLVEVLAADASKPAIRALLETLNDAEPRLAVRIRSHLVRSERATRKVLEAWQEDPTLKQDADGRVSPRTGDLERLLRRAEAERLFLGRKSKTGSTGSYRGQYEVLEPYRIEALDICVGLVRDRALPEPGVVRAGNFEFLRPSPVHIDMEELRSMAAHAFSELARPRDISHVFELTQHLPVIEERLGRYGTWTNEFRVALGDYADLLVALYLIQPDRWRSWMDKFLRQIDEPFGWGRALASGSTFRPLILLRIGRYREAVREFEALQYSSTSRAGTHYNLACAYSQWAEHTESAPLREGMLRKALDHLEQAVDNRWSDIGWMEEDRDLLPLREKPKFRQLVQRVRRQLALPEDD